MENLSIYNALREVPKEAQKTIGGGRLKGMTDINPMWRIKALTEQFGPCGIGWRYEIVDRWIETAMAKDEITANVQINLYIKHEDEWSEAIPGIGGSMLVASERNGLYVNDECYKMALTDAISVACKALGVGANIYWSNDNTKYNDAKRPEAVELATEREKKTFLDRCKSLNVDYRNILKQIGVSGQMTKEQHGRALIVLKEIEESQKAALVEEGAPT